MKKSFRRATALTVILLVTGSLLAIAIPFQYRLYDLTQKNATRELRASFDSFRDRPVWTEKGDIDFLDYEAEIEQCVVYVDEAQDRMDRD